MKASIIIANFNNAKFIPECISSLNSQTYKDFEIILFDDNSKDNSIEEAEKFKNIKIIKNKIQTDFGSINQINAFKKCVEISTGDIIFFLDSDDYFHENKIEKIINSFSKDNNKMIIFDLPIILKDQKKIKQKNITNIFKTYWGYIHPTSCISIQKKFINNVFKSISNDKYLNVWLDLRILLFSKYIDTYNIINENLTYYRVTETNVSSNFRKYSKNWWIRRNEAHDYYFEFLKENNLTAKKNLDFYLTKLVKRLIF
jgi:glycosyltransferase involved in cell wall biosynthesis